MQQHTISGLLTVLALTCLVNVVKHEEYAQVSD